jgi:deoxycytidine triphosphate deaminase
MKTGILVHQELIQLIRDGVIEAPESAVGPSSVDVTLGDEFLYEHDRGMRAAVMFDPAKGGRPTIAKTLGYYTINPGEFCLAHIREKVNLPAYISAEFRLTSTEARCGIQHALAVWADCGWSGRLTLELSNALKYHSIRLSEGMRIGQLIFHKHAVSKSPYKGRYQGDETVSAGKEKV